MLIKKYKTKIRILIFDFSNNFPSIGKPLVIGWNFIHKLKFKLGKKNFKIKGMLKEEITKIIFNKICLVNPQEIKYYLSNKLNKSNKSSQILEGDWDLSKKTIEDDLINNAFKQKFKEGKNWENTKFYQQVLTQLSNGIILWNCENKEELDKILKEIELLYNQIQADVYDSKTLISRFNEWIEKLEMPTYLKDIKINISREGNLLLISGKLILSIAKLLKIPIIPVLINARHQKWVDFKKDLLYVSRKGWLYQCPAHPDLQGYVFKHGDIRFNLIKENLSISHGTLLDIGANFGFFSHKFEEIGFDCFAVEFNEYNVYFLKKLKIAANKKFKIIPMSIFNYKRGQELNFDVILALNVFHHFLRRKTEFLNLIKLLKRIQVKELYFGPHNPKEFLNIKTYRNFTPEQFVNLIIENSCLSKAKLIGQTKDGRSLYKLTSEI